MSLVYPEYHIPTQREIAEAGTVIVEKEVAKELVTLLDSGIILPAKDMSDLVSLIQSFNIDNKRVVYEALRRVRNKREYDAIFLTDNILEQYVDIGRDISRYDRGSITAEEKIKKDYARAELACEELSKKLRERFA